MKINKDNGFLRDWRFACQNLADYFAERYFDKDPEIWWVADQVGGVLFINDYFFSVDDIVQFIENNYSAKKMFEYYNFALKWAEKNTNIGYGSRENPPISIKNYKKLKRIPRWKRN